MESVDPYDCDKEPKTVAFDFGSAIPSMTLGSWRGAYSELAIGYKLTGYDVTNVHHSDSCTITEFIELLKDAVLKPFTGWKGGEFIMSDDTPVWVSNYGNASDTAITGILDLGWRIILVTKFMQY